MVGNEPRNAWQWLLLFTPAVAAMVASWAANTFAPVPLIEYQGRQIPNVEAVIGQGLTVALTAISIVSFGVASIFPGGGSMLKRSINALCIFLWLVVVNACVAFGGCTAAAWVDSAIR